MDTGAVIGLLWTAGLVVLLVLVGIARRAGRKGNAFQAGLVGSMHDWHNKDKQKALEVLVNEKTAKKTPAHPDDPPKAGDV
jgi:hypothetical protein